MLLLGIGLLLGAVVLGLYGVRRTRRTLPPPVAPPGQPGDVAELNGIALPYGETQRSSLSETPCVWHAHEVRRHYRPSPEAEPVWDSIADHTGEAPFTVVHRGRPVLVAPGGAWAEGSDEVLSRRIGPPKRGERSPDADLMRRVAGRISGVFRGETLAFEYLEWAVPEGAAVRVRGRVGEHEGRPALLLAKGDDAFTVVPGQEDRGRPLLPYAIGTAALAATGLTAIIAGL